MLELIVLVVIGTSIWVFIDAPTHRLSWTWGLGTLALWVVVFPLYLVERSKAIRIDAGPVTPRPAQTATGGRWETDPRDPGRERWREGERWTRATRIRE